MIPIKGKRVTEGVGWDKFNKFNKVSDKYLPDSGEGDSLATQAVTAVCKLVYKWYNDGDVFDNVHSGMEGWANDLSSYANWLYNNLPTTRGILNGIEDCFKDDSYEQLLYLLASKVMKEDFLAELAEHPKSGSVYDCDGPFEFSDSLDEEDDDYDDDYYDEEEDDYDEEDY